MKIDISTFVRTMLPFHKRQPNRLALLSVFGDKGKSEVDFLVSERDKKSQLLTVTSQVMSLQNYLNTLFGPGVSIEHYYNDSKGFFLEVEGFERAVYLSMGGISNVTYGRLYNYHVVVDSASKGFIDDFHVPTNDEWNVLRDYVNATYNQSPFNYGVGNHLKSLRMSGRNGLTDSDHPRWDYHAVNYGRDTVNFDAHQSFYCNEFGAYSTAYSFYWTSDEHNSIQARLKALSILSPNLLQTDLHKNTGAAIRLVRLATTEEQSLPDGTLLEQVTDYDTNIYDAVKIGTQVWIKQNFASAHFANGDAIPRSNGNWGGSVPLYTHYNGIDAWPFVRGALNEFGGIENEQNNDYPSDPGVNFWGWENEDFFYYDHASFDAYLDGEVQVSLDYDYVVFVPAGVAVIDVKEAIENLRNAGKTFNVINKD